MNERIKELAKEADIKFSAHWQHQGIDTAVIIPTDLEKFAELIVRECIDCLKPLSRNHSMVGAAQDTIKEHFGVEE